MIPEHVNNLQDLAAWFDEIAGREREMAEAFRIAGKYQLARNGDRQALLWTLAAMACQEHRSCPSAGSTQD